MRFGWDPAKAASNAKKHKVTFDVAKTVFYDDFAVQFFDEEHSSREDRFLMLGLRSDARLLLVCHCETGMSSASSRLARLRTAKPSTTGVI